MLCSWGCPGSALFASLGFAVWHLLFSQALPRAAEELLGCGARDSSAHGTICEPQAWERAPGQGEGERRNASLERRSRKCGKLIRAGLACLDKPRWACKALDAERAIACGSCAVGFTCVCFQAGLLALCSPRRFQQLGLLLSPGQQHLGSPLQSTQLPRHYSGFLEAGADCGRVFWGGHSV